MSVVQARNTGATYADTLLVFTCETSSGNSHDTEREHARQSKALPQRDFDIEEISGWPQEDQEVAKGVLRRVDIIDSLDVQAFGSANVLENVPVSTHRSSINISEMTLS